MGGCYYTTKQGDMWDYIAWLVYKDEYLSYVLMEALENKSYIEVYIFPEGVKIWCPYVEESIETSGDPEWRDDG